ncbi:hypothetical protein BaRGS_00000865 [Batillaria attramentaria]|uniref:Uncharacterized protein n=1 Tax=Batillaria attramentaria TaxID=370345 RepID=A0ABD0M8Q3_9CAEN
MNFITYFLEEALERELFCLLNAASKKKQQYDRACSACHLLLRPWPKKSSKKVDIGEAGQGDVKNCVSGNEPDPKEVAELKVVNDVLSKALKARKKMSPKELTREQDVANVETENSSASIQENVNSNPTLGNEIWEVCDSDSADDSARNASSKSKTGPVCKPIKTPVNPESARRNKTLHAGEEGTGCHDNEVRNLNGSQSSRTGSSKDLWSPEDVLHAKLVVEFILSSFSALAEEADVLTRRIPLCLASKLCYTSIQQLRQYCSLQLKVQNLQYQLHLMRLLTSDFLPVLEKHLPQWVPIFL